MLGIFGKVKGAAGALANQAAEACGGGIDTARGILDGVADASGDLEAIGYTVRDIEVAVGIPPSVTVFLSRTGTPTDDAFGAALARRSDQSTAWLLIKMAQQADRLSGKLRVGGRCCREIAIDLGIRPAVRFLFGRDAVSAPPRPAEQAKPAEPPPGTADCPA